VWDLKAHTEIQVFPASGRRKSRGGVLILNDERAVRACVAEQGLGFLVLSGEGVMDEDGDFVAWQRARKLAAGLRVVPSNTGTSRTRKRAFTPLRVDAVWIEDTPAFEAALLSGHLAVRPIGRQPPRIAGGSGAVRADKVQISLSKSRSSLLVASGTWPDPGGRA
jgi:hypothetical protein